MRQLPFLPSDHDLGRPDAPRNGLVRIVAAERPELDRIGGKAGAERGAPGGDIIEGADLA